MARMRWTAVRLAAVALVTLAATLLIDRALETAWTREDAALEERADREMRERFQAVAEEVWRTNGL